MSAAAVVVAAAGVAVFATLVTLPPGTAAGEPLGMFTAVWGSPIFLRVSGAALVSLAGIWWLLGRGRGGGLRMEPDVAGRHLLAPFLWGAGVPLLSLLLDPWSFHSTAYVTGLVGIVAGGVVAVERSRRSQRPLFGSPRRGVLLLAALTVVIPTALALPGPPWFHSISGDEPHYLVTARSLWIDGDVDVSNEYGQGLTQPFWNAELSAHAKPGIDPGAQYPIHGSGLSVWLAPWFGVGQGLSEPWFNALVRFAMSLWLAAATVALYFLLRDLAGREVALPGTALAALTLPLLFAGPHLFPAVPVFALSCGAYVLLRRDVTPARAAIAGVMLACLPWLHFKFFGLMAAVAGIGVWFLWRGTADRSVDRHQDAIETRRRPGVPGATNRKRSTGQHRHGSEDLVAGDGDERAATRYGTVSPFVDARDEAVETERGGADGTTRRRSPRLVPLAALVLPLLLSTAGHLAFTWSLYGRLSPLAIHVGADPTLRATAAGDDWFAYLTDPLGAMITAIGYFLDQREGLLFYAPQYLLAAAGFAWLARRRRADAIALAFAFASLVGPYALSQEIGHWAPPARPLTGVLWVLAVGMGVGLALPAGGGRRGAARSALRAVLVTWGVCAAAMLMLQPDLLYHDFNVGRSLALLRYGAPGLPLSEMAPLWLGPDAVRWGVSLLGLALVVALGVFLWRWGSDVAVNERTELSACSPQAPGPARGLPGAKAPPLDATVVGPDASIAQPDARATPPASASTTMRGNGMETTRRADNPDARWASRVATAFVLIAAVSMLAHHAFVPVSDLHESWTYGQLRYWRPQSPPTRAWGEPEGLWTGGDDSVDLLLSSPEPLAQIVFELDALAALEAEIQLGRDRRSIRVVPGERALARLNPGPGRRWNGEYFYHLQVVAQGSASRASLGLGDDTRGLGVLLRATQWEN